MNEKIIEMLKKPIPRLIFSLLCGLAYFVILITIISGYTEHIALMGLFIAPLIIAGGAYIVIVILRKALEAEDEINTRSVTATFYMNLFIIAAALLIALKSVLM